MTGVLFTVTYPFCINSFACAPSYAMFDSFMNCPSLIIPVTFIVGVFFILFFLDSVFIHLYIS